MQIRKHFLRRGLSIVIAGILLLLAGWYASADIDRAASDPATCQGTVGRDWVHGGPECLHIQTYRSAGLTTHPDLVVVLHGDAPFNNPSYQYELARDVSADNDDVIAVALLRPGYTDASGNRSSGTRGHTTGDNYTPDVIDAIVGAITSLANAYRPAHVILVGHSGGATIAADIIARYPNVASAAVLVSCPCDVPVFRAHMSALQHNPMWRLPVRSLSPMELASNINSSTRVRLVIGSSDEIASPSLSREYAAKLRQNRVRVSLTELPGAGHEIFLDPRVREVIKATLEEVRSAQ